MEYPKELYEAGEYVMRVKLMKSFYGIWYFVTSASSTFRLTGNFIYMQSYIFLFNSHFMISKVG